MVMIFLVDSDDMHVIFVLLDVAISAFNHRWQKQGGIKLHCFIYSTSVNWKERV